MTCSARSRSLSLAARPAGRGGCAHSAPRPPARPRRRQHVHHAAESRSAHRPHGRPDGRAGGHLESAGGLEDAPAARSSSGHHQLRPGLHRALRHPGELQRLPGLGHRGPAASRCSRPPTSARRRRATSRCTGTCCSSPARTSRPGSTAAREGVTDTVSNERLRGRPDLRHHRHHPSEERRQRADLPRLAHPHGAGRPEGHGQRLRLHLRLLAGAVVRASCPAAWRRTPSEDPNSALFRIEVIKVPLAHPEQAAIVSSPRIFQDLVAPPKHGETPEDIAASKKADRRRARRGRLHRDDATARRSCSRTRLVVHAARRASWRPGTARGAPTAADSATLREALPGIVGPDGRPAAGANPDGTKPGPTQCHDITVYPAIGLAGGACGGYGLLLDISDPANPKRHRRRGRLQLLLLALGHVQQRRHQAPVLRRVGRRRPAQVPGHGQAGVGRGRDLHARRPASCSSRATTRCSRRRRRRRTAWPTTAR